MGGLVVVGMMRSGVEVGKGCPGGAVKEGSSHHPPGLALVVTGMGVKRARMRRKGALEAAAVAGGLMGLVMIPSEGRRVRGL